MWQTCTSELSADAVDASRRSSESKVPMMPCLKQVTHVNYSFILSPCRIEILLFNCVTPLEARLQMEVCGNGKAYAAKTTALLPSKSLRCSTRLQATCEHHAWLIQLRRKRLPEGSKTTDSRVGSNSAKKLQKTAKKYSPRAT